MAKAEARRIRLFFIDDDPPVIPAPSIEIIRLESLSDVQDMLIGGERPPADLIVCDVNMEKRELDHPEEVIWGAEGALPGYGPLLALPFLRSEIICEFAAASSWWIRVRNDGYVLVAIALLLSVISRRPYGLQEARAWIDEQVQAREVLLKRAAGGSPTADALGNPEPGITISAGLVGLRRKLVAACEQSRLTISGLETTLQALRSWKRGKLVEEDGGPARIELLYPDRSDSIALNSLFADVLSFAEVPDAGQVDQIASELQAWIDRDTCFQFPRTTDLYEHAAQLLINRLPQKRDLKPKTSSLSNGLKERARAAGNATGLDQHLLIRTTIIFAFLRAWYFERILVGIYDAAEGTFNLMDWAYWFLDIHPRNRPHNPFNRLLGAEINKRIYISTERHRHPFDSSAKSVFAAYSALKSNKRLDLTAAEKSLGRRFIADATRFFPRGVKAQDKKVWEPHLEDQMMAYPAWLI